MLDYPAQMLSLFIGVTIFAGMSLMAFVSKKEEEPHAVRRSVMLAVLLPLPYFAAAALRTDLGTIAAAVLSLLFVLAILLLLLPIGSQFEAEADAPDYQYDERDIMFSRRALVPGSDRFIAYYRRRPEKMELDEKWRSRPGLMEPGALFHDPITVAAATSSFKTVAAFHAILDEELPSVNQDAVEPTAMSRFVKQWAKKLGAVSVGITELRPYHLYSHIGRGQRYGEPVQLSHKFAVALTVEMDKLLLDRAPTGPTVMESAQQYLNSGAIAVQLAEFARHLGYPARAHIDGSYRLICPLVARDAGLGEIGRMGLLMTPELGPRVRIAVVTTDLPLKPDIRERELSMIDFCTRCKKCADACPSRSISFEDQIEIGGIKRWRIDSESCFTYWCTVGTDCGRCMSVCPYSHPNNLMHNIVRAGIRRSGPFRRLALTLDDFFYGREPATLDAPNWLDGVQRDFRQ